MNKEVPYEKIIKMQEENKKIVDKSYIHKEILVQYLMQIEEKKLIYRKASKENPNLKSKAIYLSGQVDLLKEILEKPTLKIKQLDKRTRKEKE